MTKTILITGVAGFIGYSLAQHLSDNTGHTIIGIDNLNDYYDIKLKTDRLKKLDKKIIFTQTDLNDDLSELFQINTFDCVVNLAAQAGVRYSKKNPDVYIKSNIDGFYNLLNASQKYGVKKIIYASSSSVYGANIKLPFVESDQVATPMSLYAATKLANENIASGFFYTHGLRTIGLRFFNIYGPFGRPDMAYFKWSNNLMNGMPITLNNCGDMWRDMTYIDDCVEAISKLIENDELEDAPEIYNIGNRQPVRIGDLLDFISTELQKKPKINITQAGSEEPIKTWANTKKLEEKINFSPNTDFHHGVKEFLRWYKEYYD